MASGQSCSGYKGIEGIDRELILSAWRLFLEALARQAPYIVVFENLHRASESLSGSLCLLQRAGLAAPDRIEQARTAGPASWLGRSWE